MGVEYNGSAYHGWQFQENSSSVQARVEQALSQVANGPVRVSCAGRTDTGVHALGQVVHFDADVQRSERSWVFGANSHLPADIVVTWARQVDPSFHARFSAQSRYYRYVIFNRPVRPSILASRVTWDYRPLDVSRMQEAASHLIGQHDFTSYRALACQAKSPERNLFRLEVNRRHDLITLDLGANGFLHHMVRNIAGVLMTIGAGLQEPDWSRQVLLYRDRTLGGITASPHGLYFMAATYPDKFEIPRLPPTAMVW